MVTTSGQYEIEQAALIALAVLLRRRLQNLHGALESIHPTWARRPPTRNFKLTNQF